MYTLFVAMATVVTVMFAVPLDIAHSGAMNVVLPGRFVVVELSTLVV